MLFLSGGGEVGEGRRRYGKTLIFFSEFEQPKLNLHFDIRILEKLTYSWNYVTYIDYFSYNSLPIKITNHLHGWKLFDQNRKGEFSEESGHKGSKCSAVERTLVWESESLAFESYISLGLNGQGMTRVSEAGPPVPDGVTGWASRHEWVCLPC